MLSEPAGSAFEVAVLDVQVAVPVAEMGASKHRVVEPEPPEVV
jgi:hypothetical protein